MRTAKWLLLVAAAALGPGVGHAVTDPERLATYQEFRAAFDARRYQDALPLAEKLVTLTEEQYGKSDRALVTPLANLGTTQYRLKDYKSAEDTYLRSVKIATATGGTADRLLLPPLHGLGATYYAMQQYEDATNTLQRALDLSRNLDGLLNPGQLTILDPLIGSLVSLERHAEADREFQYAARVAESAYGAKDVRVIPYVDRYAHWLEDMGRYPAARVEYARELTIAEVAGPRAPRLVIEPLLGIARSYRLEADNAGPDEATPYVDPFASGLSLLTQPTAHNPNPDGEKALQVALDTIDKTKPTDHRARGRTLMEMGDWYLCADQFDKSFGRYREAWKEFQQAGSTDIFSAPRQLAYRAPTIAANRSPNAERDDFEEHTVDATFLVTREGRTKDVTLGSTEASPAQQKSVSNALRHARYGPRLENGEPVDTPGVKFSEKVVSKKPRP
ncbi:MAG TPA: tetratricopeptide repeat protein [Steroidobacteraceae bacterium]|nr:tetratricopeptide repeat protein [Steroidobacteraceae bacterium]